MSSEPLLQRRAPAWLALAIRRTLRMRVPSRIASQTRQPSRACLAVVVGALPLAAGWLLAACADRPEPVAKATTAAVVAALPTSTLAPEPTLVPAATSGPTPTLIPTPTPAPAPTSLPEPTPTPDPIDTPCSIDAGERWLSWDFWRGAGVEDVRSELDCGTEIETKDNDGWTPLHLAAALNRQPSVVTLLLDRGADVEAKDDRGATPLFRAAWRKEPSVVTALLDRGADIEAKSDDGWTPLHAVALNGELPVVTVLLDHGAEIEAKTARGSTPLHLVAAWSK